LTAYWGATAVQVGAVAFDVKVLKQASKVTMMALLLSWTRSQQAAYVLLLTATAVASHWHNPRSGLGGAFLLHLRPPARPLTIKGRARRS
jgi:hypothetical protein